MVLSDLYRQYLADIRRNVSLYASKSKSLRVKLLLERNNVVKHYNRIALIFKFDIRKFAEVKDPYNMNVSDNLINKMLAVNTKKLDESISEEAEYYRILIIEYCKLRHLVYKTRNLFKYYCKHNSITLDEYKRIIYNYYEVVHNKILDGDVYMMGNRLGNISITRYEIDKTAPSYNNFIDLKATAILKRQLIEKGLTPYNKLDAEAAAKKGIKYNGIPYIIYGTEETYLFKLRWSNCKISNYRTMKFVKSNYNLTGSNILDIVPELDKYSETDIRKLNCAVNYKLSLLREKNKHIENNFAIWERRDM